MVKPKERIMWYYTLNNQQVGPVDENEIKRLVASGAITHASLVWTTGMATWQPIGQTPLAPLMGSIPPPPVVGFPPAVVYENPKVTQLKKLFMWFWIALAVGIGLIFLGLILLIVGNFRATLFGTVLIYLGAIPMTVSLIPFFMLIHKAWELVQHEGIRATPDQAVAYCFIPGWNYYWFFPAFRGLAREINKVLESEHISAEPVSIDLALWFVIMILATPLIIPVIPLIVLWYLYTSKIKNAAIAIVNARKD
jgi:hypothetical protein